MLIFSINPGAKELEIGLILSTFRKKLLMGNHCQVDVIYKPTHSAAGLLFFQIVEAASPPLSPLTAGVWGIDS